MTDEISLASSKKEGNNDSVKKKKRWLKNNVVKNKSH
jgi:hypothetical protein